jgi:cob(I)alamin adenosyltransferase
MDRLEEMEKLKDNLEEVNHDLVEGLLKNKVTASELEWLDASIEQTLARLEDLRDTIQAGKRLT